MVSTADVLGTTRDLIAISSVNPMGAPLSAARPGERVVMDYIVDVLRRHRIDHQVYASDQGRPTLVASVDVGIPGALLLEAHADTVPVENMTILPFDPVLRHGRLYGRGSCDTKGSVAAFLCALLHATETGRLRSNVLFAVTADEESAQLGARALVREGIQAKAAIVGEPTSLRIVRAHKGICQFRMEARGRSAHASIPGGGDNAILKMARALERISEYAREFVHRSRSDSMVPTLNVGTISGGTGVNVVPDRCVVSIDRRLVAGETPQGCAQELRGVLSCLGADAPSVDPPYLELPALSTDADSDAVQALGGVLESMSLPSAPAVSNFWTEAALFSRAGIPSIVFGPGSIDQAHTSDEFCPVDDIHDAYEAVRRLLVGA